MSERKLSRASHLEELGWRLIDWSTLGWSTDERFQNWSTDERFQKWSKVSTYVFLGLWVSLLSLDILAQGGGGGGGGTGGGGIGTSRAQAQQALTAGRSLLVVVRWATYIVGSIFVLWGFGTLERNGWIKIACGALMLTWELWVALVTMIASGGYDSANDLPDLRRP